MFPVYLGVGVGREFTLSRERTVLRRKRPAEVFQVADSPVKKSLETLRIGALQSGIASAKSPSPAPRQDPRSVHLSEADAAGESLLTAFGAS